MRTTKELLEVMLENIDKLESGLCKLNSRLHDYKIFSLREAHEVYVHFAYNLPAKRHRLPDTRLIVYCWPCGEKEPRIKWLKEQIEKLK